MNYKYNSIYIYRNKNNLIFTFLQKSGESKSSIFNDKIRDNFNTVCRRNSSKVGVS